jgi:nicotinamide-nucleotide amidase
MEAIILNIGDELVSGQTLETNGAWLARRLAETGVPVKRFVTVGDDLARIRQAITAAASDADLVLITGGLGPTQDDLTRTALAESLGVPLEMDERSLQRVRDFFAWRRREMPERNAIQAMFPKGAQPIDNTCGTAPGIQVCLGRAGVYAMPGVPREMKAMFDRDVLPKLADASSEVVVTKTLRCFGAGESTIAEHLGDLMQRGRTPSVGTGANEGIISIRISARGPREQAGRHVAATAEQIRGKLGRIVFGADGDTLAGAVAALLTSNGKTVATAESCTGGLVAKLLTDIPGSSQYFLGGIVAYANEVKAGLLGVSTELIDTCGAVSAEVARAMAENARARFDSDFAIGITGIAGPGGGSDQKPVGLVYVALAGPAQCQVVEHRFAPEQGRAVIRGRVASAVLDMLRLRLMH